MSEGRPKRKAALAASPDRESSASKRQRREHTAASSVVSADNVTDPGDFTGKTFQQAQEQIINELIKYTDDEGLEIFSIFAMLPSRSLTNYYALIKKPTSLSSVRKKVYGQEGRGAPTGRTFLKSWDAFETEVSWIWRNAREYNEDGSGVYNLAGELEEHFKMRLAAAKDQVDAPERLKITLPKAKEKEKIMISLGDRKNKPSPAPNAAPGVTIDNDALRRQRQMVQAGVNGHQTADHSPKPTTISLKARSSSAVPPPTPVSNGTQPSAAAASPPLAVNNVKNENEQKTQTPAPTTTIVLPTSTAPEPARPSPRPPSSMPPPALHPPSGSPLASQVVTAPATQHNHVPIYPTVPASALDNKLRGPGKSVAEAFLTNVTLTTHPHLKLPKPYSVVIPPSPTTTQQSLTVNLPNSHYLLRISPTVSPLLISGRQYKLFVTANNQRLIASPSLNGDPRRIYDCSLQQGVNRVDVEIAAMRDRGDMLENEKLLLYVNLMRP
ncbi:hypothetical protein LTR66_001930 [Elasticomyces elasticus]|nr:hypothetical protein LTR66_001930 [Elasticomyces elasticus]